MKLLFFTLICIVFIGIKGICNTEIKPNFSNITVRDGLSHGWIKSIVQDKQGFMWFGTNDGLCKYDGKNFKTYRYEQGNQNSLYSNLISSLYLDAVGDVWICTNAGLNYYDYRKDKIVRVKDITSFVSGIFQTDDGSFVISSYNGIITYNKADNNIKTYVNEDLKEYDKLNRFRIMIAYKNDALVFAYGGCYKFDTKEKTFSLLFADNDVFKGPNIRSALINENTLWMGNLDKGLSYVRLDTVDSPKAYSNSIIDQETVSSLLSNHKNELIIGCENNGLVYLDLKNKNLLTPIKNISNPYNEPNGLINNSVHSIFEDKQNNLWIGTYNGVSYQYNEGKGFSSLVSNVKNKNSLADDMVSSMLEVNKQLWVGTEKGIDVFDDRMNKLKSYTANGANGNTLLASAILTLALDDFGNIWAGSWSGGIDIINAEGNIVKQLTKGTTNQSISHNSVMSIAKDMHGNMWVGSMGGGVDVYLKSSQKFIRYQMQMNNPNSISNDWVLCFLVTSENEIWVSTHNGLDLYNEEQNSYHHFAHEESNHSSLAGTGVECMFEDNKGELWFGTPAGLSRFNRADSTFINYYEADGLPNNYIQSIVCDNKNQLWIGTNAGLSKLTVDENNNHAKFANYSMDDGLIGNEFVRRASYKKSNGDLYFGTKNGLVYFNPAHIIDNSFVPEVYFTSLQINNKEVFANDERAILSENICFNPDVELKHNQSNISISFSALNYVVPGKNRYQYKMQNFDDEWVELGQETKATYTNIPYGEYEFKVKASNNSAVWNNEGAKLNIHITPPWYRTKLAYALYFGIIMLLVLSYRYFIIRQISLESKLELEIVEKENLNRISKMKTRFFTNISHEFLTPLSLILSPLETLNSDAEFINTHLKTKIQPVYNNAKRLQRLINQLLDISKINADHLDLKVSLGNIHTFVHDIFIGFKNLAQQKNILLEFNATLANDLVYFDADKMEKIIYNLLSNAIKFTPEKGSVTLSLCFESEYLNIKVEDTGIGIDAFEKDLVFDSFYQSKHAKNSNYLGTGVGLNLVKGLVNVYGGTIELISSVNKGSCFSINLPYKQTGFAASAISEQKFDNEPHLDVEEIDLPEDKGNKEQDFNALLPNVLLVEDNIELNAHIVDVLSDRFNVTSAFDGEQGMYLAKKIIPDLIIADWVMPKMDGINMLSNLRNNESTSHIPIIILTAKIDDESKMQGIKEGADAYITKPFEKKHLVISIENLMKTRESLKNIYKKNIVIEPTQIKITSVDEKFITKAIKIVEENFSNQDFSVEFMASEIGMSRAQLHRKITGLLGMSTGSFIRDIKIKKAADLLTIGQLRVSEVMFEVNIKSRNYFTKCFKEQYGMLPTEFIKQYKETLKG